LAAPSSLFPAPPKLFPVNTEAIQTHTSTFEASAQQTETGVEYWLARDLQQLLGYDEWRNFSTAITKAKTACECSGHRIADHFADVGKIVTLGSEYPLDTRHAFHTLPRRSQPLRHTITMHTRKNHCPKHTALRFN
jgi:DNA-damage-inducible protein D